jgi:hypothetical protein
MGGDVEGAEVGGGFWVCGFFFGEDLLEAIGVVGDDAVDAEVDEGADFFGVVGGPGDYLEAGFVEFGDVDGGIGAEDGGVDGGEGGGAPAIARSGQEGRIGLLGKCDAGG